MWPNLIFHFLCKETASHYILDWNFSYKNPIIFNINVNPQLMTIFLCVCSFNNYGNILFKIAGFVPVRKSIIQWVDTFMNTGSVRKNEQVSSRTTRSSKNIQRVRKDVLKSRKRFTLKHAATLSISYQIVRRIVFENLKISSIKNFRGAKPNSRVSISRKRRKEKTCDIAVERPRELHAERDV